MAGYLWDLVSFNKTFKDFYFLAAHCLEINTRKLKAEELKVGLGKLLKDFYTHEEGAMIISVSICLFEFIKDNKIQFFTHLLNFDRFFWFIYSSS